MVGFSGCFWGDCGMVCNTGVRWGFGFGGQRWFSGSRFGFFSGLVFGLDSVVLA